MPVHADNECKVLKANKYKYPLDERNGTKDEARILPLILRAYAVAYQQKEIWNKLVELLQWSFKENVDLLKPKTGNSCAFPVFSEDDESLLPQLISVHKLSLTHSYEQIFETFFMKARFFLYNKASNFTHSCAPNCDWIITEFPEFKIVLRISVPVKKGEILTVLRSIYGGSFHLGTLKRQLAFQELYNTSCKCNLCVDPTELGTYQSAMVCPSCVKPARYNRYESDDLNTVTEPNQGYLLPKDPLDTSENSKWECNKCHRLVSGSAFLPQINQMYNNLQNCINKKGSQKNLLLVDLKNFVQRLLEEMTKKYSDKFMHPNHWVFQEAVAACHTIQVQLLEAAEIKNEAKKDDWFKIEKFGEFLLNVYNLRRVGMQYRRVIHLSLLSKAMSKRLICCRVLLRNKSKDELEEIRQEVVTCIEVQEECATYVKDGFQLRSVDMDISGNKNIRIVKFKGVLQKLNEFLERIDTKLAELEMEQLNLGKD